MNAEIDPIGESAREWVAKWKERTEAAHIADIIRTFRDRAGGWPLVVGEDGRIGRLEQANLNAIDYRYENGHLTRTHAEPVYRVCWDDGAPA